MPADIEPEILRAILRYDDQEGRLFWKERPAELFADTGPGGAEGTAKRWNACWSGREAFVTIRRDGYRHGIIFLRSYLGHRVAFAIFHGRWPQSHLDHIDGDKANNRIANLREVTRSQNCINTRSRNNTSSGFRGVSWNKKSQAWMVRIQCGGVRHQLGMFDDLNKARNAYDVAARRLHGEFRRASTC